MQADELHELPQIMEQITDIMSARESVLTLHPDGGALERVIYAKSADGPSESMRVQLRREHARWRGAESNGGPQWIVYTEGVTEFDVMLIFVGPAETQSQLIISVFFDRLTPEIKRKAELIYERRAPFAIGYFRLWQLNRSSERAIESLQAALNLSGLGIILLNRNNKIVFANHVADSLLNHGAGLRRVNGGLRTHDLGDSVRLQVAIEHVMTSHCDVSASDVRHRAPLLSVKRLGQSALMLSVLPTQVAPEEASDIAAIIYIMDPARKVQDLLRPVCKVYHLSPVETQLACHIVSGETLSQAAEIMRVKSMTARSYLKQIFLKTDTHRQSELIQVMLSSIIQTNPIIISEPF